MQAMLLHRSTGFWLGLPIAVFLLWVWVDSRGHLRSWSRSSGITPKHNTWVGLLKSEILFTGKEIAGKEETLYDGAPPMHFLSTPEWGKFQHIPFPAAEDPGQWFPAPRVLDTREPMGMDFGSGDELRVETHGMALPLWLVLGSYLALWIGLLVWWRRRKRRLAPAIGS